jgi:hypothetical protein
MLNLQKLYKNQVLSLFHLYFSLFVQLISYMLFWVKRCKNSKNVSPICAKGGSCDESIIFVKFMKYCYSQHLCATISPTSDGAPGCIAVSFTDMSKAHKRLFSSHRLLRSAQAFALLFRSQAC